MLPVAILAGGLATRLRPLTDGLPKALLRIAGRPFVFHQLELLKEQGVERVVLCVGHLGSQVCGAVGAGGGFGLAIQYSFDGDNLLGTGGAVKKALPLLGDHFFVLNGDSYLPCSFPEVQAAFEAAKRPALMTVLRNDNRWDTSNVLFRDGAVIEYDKKRPQPDMSHIDYGLSVFSREIFSRAVASSNGGAATLDLGDMCRELAQRGQLAAMEMSERFYEVGSAQGIRETEEFLVRRSAHA